MSCGLVARLDNVILSSDQSNLWKKLMFSFASTVVCVVWSSCQRVWCTVLTSDFHLYRDFTCTRTQSSMTECAIEYIPPFWPKISTRRTTLNSLRERYETTKQQRHYYYPKAPNRLVRRIRPSKCTSSTVAPEPVQTHWPRLLRSFHTMPWRIRACGE